MKLLGIKLLLTRLGFLLKSARLAAGLLFFLLLVVKSADWIVIAAGLVTLDPLVLVRVVQALNCCVTLFAKNTFLALAPAGAVGESLTVFRGVTEVLRRSSEITRVVGEVAALGVVRILVDAPTGFIPEHIKDENVFSSEHFQVLLEAVRRHQALRHEVVLDANYANKPISLLLALHCPLITWMVFNSSSEKLYKLFGYCVLL